MINTKHSTIFHSSFYLLIFNFESSFQSWFAVIWFWLFRFLLKLFGTQSGGVFGAVPVLLCEFFRILKIKSSPAFHLCKKCIPPYFDSTLFILMKNARKTFTTPKLKIKNQIENVSRTCCWSCSQLTRSKMIVISRVLSK